MFRLRCRLVIGFCLVVGGCQGPPWGGQARQDSADRRLRALFDEYWRLTLREQPTRATYLGDHRYDDRLEDLSDDARRAAIAARRGLLKRLDAVDVGAASDANRLSAEIFRRMLVDDVEMAELPDHLMPIRQQEGPHITLPLLKLSQPLDTAPQCRLYAARLAAFPRQVEQAIARMREGIRRGIVPPKIIIKKSLPQIEAQIHDDPRRSDLFLAYAEKHPDPESSLAAEVNTLMADATRAAIDGYRKLRDFLRDEYLPNCTDTVGVCHLPGGREWYARAARYHTTTRKPPDQIHRIGLDEMARIRTEMQAVMDHVGFKGDVARFCEHLRNRPDLHAASASELMEGHAAILRRSDALLPTLFGRLPKAPYRLKEIEPFRAPAAPAAYYYQAPDNGSRPAYFYVNTFEPQKRPKFTMEALAYHEAMPGHHLQISLAQENTDLPDFRRHASFTVFVEGWALYSECLGKQLGGYGDPYSEFGRLTFDAWRACRLVVDTGMHALGWTREQAIDYMKRNTSLSDLDIESEIDRYVAWPGQALAYKIGQLEISRMRAEAEQTLGARFDLRSFHDELLAEGPLPLDILETRMKTWLARALSGD